MRDNLTVFIVDDDPAVRDSLGLLLGVRAYRTALFADAESFLEAYRPEWRGCVLIDLRMPGLDGLALQARLRELGCRMPCIIITAHGDVASARTAFRAAAIDFIEKPIDHEKLLAGIEQAFDLQAGEAGAEADEGEAGSLLSSLTPREMEVMERAIAGRHNREIAVELGISPRTVEVHKARMMDKLRVRNVAELVRLHLGRTPR